MGWVCRRCGNELSFGEEECPVCKSKRPGYLGLERFITAFDVRLAGAPASLIPPFLIHWIVRVWVVTLSAILLGISVGYPVFTEAASVDRVASRIDSLGSMAVRQGLEEAANRALASWEQAAASIAEGTEDKWEDVEILSNLDLSSEFLTMRKNLDALDQCMPRLEQAAAWIAEKAIIVKTRVGIAINVAINML